MSLRSSFRKTAIAVMCVLILFAAAGAAAPTARAASPLSLTVTCVNGATPLTGMQVRLYKAAVINADGTYTLTGAFASYPVSLKDTSASGLSAAANTLAAYTVVDSLAAQASAAADAQGKVTFAGLSEGLYLIVADKVTIGGYDYTIAPFLAAVSASAAGGGSTVTAEPKSESKEPTSGPGGYMWYSVVKVWNDKGWESKRSASVTVSLYKNGVFVESQTLSADNDWKYAWRTENDGSVWTVTETVPSPYTMTVTSADNTFTVTNTYSGTTTTPGGGGSLPQTGQLWWPVPLLAGAGIILIFVGWKLTAEKRKHD